MQLELSASAGAYFKENTAMYKATAGPNISQASANIAVQLAAYDNLRRYRASSSGSAGPPVTIQKVEDVMEFALME